MKKDHWFYVIAVLAGILVWVVVSSASGRREAWDSAAYFQVGMPALCMMSALMGYWSPDRAWRWGAVPLAAQLVWMLAVTDGPGNLLPLGLIVGGVLAVPSILTARLGAFITVAPPARLDSVPAFSDAATPAYLRFAHEPRARLVGDRFTRKCRGNRYSLLDDSLQPALATQRLDGPWSVCCRPHGFPIVRVRCSEIPAGHFRAGRLCTSRGARTGADGCPERSDLTQPLAAGGCHRIGVDCWPHQRER